MSPCTAEQAQAISADERVAFAGRITALGTCRLENSSLTLLLREYDGGALSAYSASLKLAEGALPRAAGEIALPRDVLTLLGCDRRDARYLEDAESADIEEACKRG